MPSADIRTTKTSPPPAAGRWLSAVFLTSLGLFVGFLAGRLAPTAPVAAPASVVVPPPPTSFSRPSAFATEAPARGEPASSSATPHWDDASWTRLRSQPGTVARNTELAAQLEALARADPTRAMALAASERNALLRESLLQAALRGWTDSAPADAAQWALALGDATKRGQAIATVLDRLAARAPDEALRLGREILRQDPGGAAGHASALANALCAQGRFELAAQFAADPGELGEVGRSILTVQTYLAWSRLQPEEAARAAAALASPAARTDALNAVVSGWGEADPAGLTQFLTQLPADAARAPLLGAALRQWANVDAAAATAWVKNNEGNLGADDGVAAVVSAGGFVAPEIAAEWTEGIASPQLRSQTALALLRTWAGTDPAAAKKYYERTAALGAGDREQAATLFGPPGAP